MDCGSASQPLRQVCKGVDVVDMFAQQDTYGQVHPLLTHKVLPNQVDTQKEAYHIRKGGRY